MRVNRIPVLVAVAVLLVLAPKLARGQEADAWASFGFLIGDWVGEGSGKPGEGTGGFTLAPDLGGKVLVRRAHSDYPASGGRPASVHDDLMIIYPAQGAKGNRAIYFDNEGHTIQYAVSASADGSSLVFLSDAEPTAPRFRLTYTRGDANVVQITFEIAPPGKPDAFQTYLRGSARRKQH